MLIKFDYRILPVVVTRFCIFLLGILLFTKAVSAQQIIDPCFQSVKEIGFFYGSETVANICGDCNDNYYAADMLEWDGSKWIGTLEFSEVDLPPPESCNSRAIWCGFDAWTAGGEGVSLKLDKPLEAGVTYSFSFTYASDGKGSDGNFSPLLYTYSIPYAFQRYYVGRFPGTNDWATNTLTFTATESQAGHEWITIKAFESSGLILGDCRMAVDSLLYNSSLPEEVTICAGEQITLAVYNNETFNYQWNTGDLSNSIVADEAGVYEVQITYGTCSAQHVTNVMTYDCEVRLVMPNLFTPNGDGPNEVFMPIEHNHIASGRMIIYNRWGKRIFSGDLFTGWTGENTLNGVYFYEVFYITKDDLPGVINGMITLIR